MAAINQLNNFLINNCYSIVLVWQLNTHVLIARDITRSHKSNATSRTQDKTMHMGIMYWVTAVETLDSHSTRYKCLRGGTAALLHPETEQVEHTGPLLQQAQASSDELRYWPAETSSSLQKNHSRLLFSPCETLGYQCTVTVVYSSCAVQILNIIQPDMRMLVS